MKSIERIPFLSNVLIVACTRMNNSDVGKLVKAVVAYTTDGSRPAIDDLRLETYFDLIAQDLDSLGGKRPYLKSQDGRKLKVVKMQDNQQMYDGFFNSMQNHLLKQYTNGGNVQSVYLDNAPYIMELK